MVIRAVSCTPFPCGIPTVCCVCHALIIPEQMMVLCLPGHEAAHAFHDEVA